MHTRSSCKANTQQSIHYLSGQVDRVGYILDHHANDHADDLIFHKGVASARHKSSVLIGDDTAVLVLLLHHADMYAHRVLSNPHNRTTSGACSNRTLHPCKFGCTITTRLFVMGKCLVVARNCVTRRCARVGKMVYIAVMCAHRMRGTSINNSELHDFPDDCMD